MTDEVLRVLLARDYNTRIVLLGTSLLGICGGVVGTFMLLRKRSLVSDVVGHASLPGIGVAFLVMEMMSPGSGKSLTGLLVGALVAGVLGILCTTGIRRFTKIKEDAAYAIVLSIFFGLGIALFTIIQRIPSGNVAGLNQFIFGKAASLRADDVQLIAIGSVVVLAIVAAFFKEFSFLCFDEESAAAVGLPVLALDLVLMGLVVGVSVIGLQSVGMLLVVAILISPAAAARFWTNDLKRMTIIAAFFGAVGSILGVMASAALPRIATGSIIVLFGSLLFVGSMLFGTERGVVRRALLHRGLSKRVGRHDLLRAIYEEIEPALANAKSPSSAEVTSRPFSFDRILKTRSWNAPELERYLRDATRTGLIRSDASGSYRLTEEGAVEAQRVVREHRLWELYLINYADVAPGMVDRDADRIEHALEPEVVAELTAMLSSRYPKPAMPPSPHPIEPAATN
ncbi:MAG: iron chelate uptake ABC transporter family permease subunit [Planctomycetaceae bacterium]